MDWVAIVIALGIYALAWIFLAWVDKLIPPGGKAN